MGNCCRRESSCSVAWAGEDWGSVVLLSENKSSHHDHDPQDEDEDEDEDQYNFSSSSSSSANRDDDDHHHHVVKMKITKKELDELMARVDLQGLSMDQALQAMLLANNSTNGQMGLHHRSWKPALQSIPELN